MTDEELLVATAKDALTRWLSDDSSIVCVFQNQALDSSNAGQRIALCYDLALWDALEVGKTRAPDTTIGTGWKYILVGKAKTVEEAITLMEFKEAK